jgi:mannosyl-oligosaccharide alpha-1,2-mannosidase
MFEATRPLRRKGLFSTALFIIFIVYLSTVSIHTARTVHLAWSNSCPSLPPTVPSFVSTVWRNLPLRYPVDTLIRLPTKRSNRRRRIQQAAPGKQKHRLDAVKAVFTRCWTSYKEHAWLKDELTPLSGVFNNRYGGWGATLVDSLDTLWIMGLEAEFEIAVTAATAIDFGNPHDEGTISIFETTIRYLGGFLSAYDLSRCRDKRLLNKAIELGDMLYAAFDTPDRMPVNSWSPGLALNGSEQIAPIENNILANLGSLTMEFTHLSQLTGDMRYFDAVQRITNTLYEQQNKTKLPGLWPQRYDVQTTDFRSGNSFTLGAEADSTYEYLIKMFILLGASDSAIQYKNMYEFAMDTASQHLLFRPMVPHNLDILLSGKVIVIDGQPSLLSESEHLTCFVGGMFALSGRVLSNTNHLITGKKLTEGCVWGYKSTRSGILPENYETIPCPQTDCEWNATLWQQEKAADLPEGFIAVRDVKYHLRPEAIESVFIMYRITGDPKYRDIAWDMFQAIEKQTGTEFGNAALYNVLLDPAPQLDNMESFWMAETLKYLYLIFSEPDLISLDEFVLNTEAHPFRIPKH